MNFPAEETRSLIDALRDELQEYGALLQLLKDQQRRLISRQADEVLNLSGSIEAQLPVVERARRRRQEEVHGLAGPVASPEDGKSGIRLSALLPFFAATVAPMVSGLVEEINRLVTSVARFARQNQMLLARAVESTQVALRAVHPTAAQTTYTPSGRLHTRLPGLYEGSSYAVA